MFDPYYTWLGIPPADQPPDHYRVLGLDRFELNPFAISNAADRQMAHVRNVGQRHPQEQATVLSRLSTARVCLLNTTKKQQYDRMLRESMRIEQGDGVDSRPPMPGPTKMDPGAQTDVDVALGDVFGWDPVTDVPAPQPVKAALVPAPLRPALVESIESAAPPMDARRRAPRWATQYQFHCYRCSRPTLHTRTGGYQVAHWFHVLILIAFGVSCLWPLAILWLGIWVLHTLFNLFNRREPFRCTQCGQDVNQATPRQLQERSHEDREWFQLQSNVAVVTAERRRAKRRILWAAVRRWPAVVDSRLKQAVGEENRILYLFICFFCGVVAMVSVIAVVYLIVG